MKNSHLAVSAAILIATAFSPRSAEAGKKELYGAVGFLSGVLIANAVSAPSYSETTYYYEDNRYRPSGRWEYHNERVWVPGYWSYEYQRCGRRIRVWNPGRYEIRSQQVWVDDCRPVRRTQRYYR
jgi:hypothetical protein